LQLLYYDSVLINKFWNYFC